jgi:hypothetical protein
VQALQVLGENTLRDGVGVAQALQIAPFSPLATPPAGDWCVSG